MIAHGKSAKRAIDQERRTWNESERYRKWKNFVTNTSERALGNGGLRDLRVTEMISDSKNDSIARQGGLSLPVTHMPSSVRKIPQERKAVVNNRSKVFYWGT
jgi:hypothetical protein